MFGQRIEDVLVEYVTAGVVQAGMLPSSRDALLVEVDLEHIIPVREK